jgi:hypothetical protein
MKMVIKEEGINQEAAVDTVEDSIIMRVDPEVVINNNIKAVVEVVTSRQPSARTSKMVSFEHLNILKIIGNCQYGSKCSFAHGDHELRRSD